MEIKPLKSDFQKLLQKHDLEKKFSKQQKLFEENPQHPSLNTEKLKPKDFNLYSFRLNRKWRVIFIIVDNEAEVVDINPHYHR